MPRPVGHPDNVLIAQLAAHASWAATVDRAARTANGRRAFRDKFLAEAGGDPVRAEHLRRVFYARLALASVRSRRRRAGTTPPPEAVRAEHRRAAAAARAALRSAQAQRQATGGPADGTP